MTFLLANINAPWRNHKQAYIPKEPATVPIPPIHDYAVPSQSHNNPVLRLYQTEVPGMNHPWFMMAQPGARASVGILPVNEQPGKEPMVILLKVARPPMGGVITLELPCGDWGGKKGDETLQQAASRELFEETDLIPQKLAPLSSQFIPISPGVSPELRALYIAQTNGKPSGTHWEADEKLTIKGFYQIPLKVFMDDNRFQRWVDESWEKDRLLVANDVYTARALLQKRRGKLLNFTA